MTGFAVVTRNLVKKRGKCRALDSLSLSVPRGSILGLVGENGAGKTTWMMSVAGFLTPDSGEINILGGGSFDASVHSGRISILPQDSELPLEMSPREALYRFARIQGLSAFSARKSADDVLKAVNLIDRANAPVRTLSHGMRKRAMVAQAFVGNPEVVLLDEPLNGLDPVEADRLRRFILSQKSRRTIVISSHNLEDVERLCTHVAVIGKGKLKKFDTLQSITQGAARIVYELSSKPGNVKRFSELVDGATFSFDEEKMSLECSLDNGSLDIAEVNRVVIPEILKETDIVTISKGQTLEEAFLHGRRASL